MKSFIHLYIFVMLLSACSDESVVTKSNINTSVKGKSLVESVESDCARSQIVKPPVDILFVVDNSGSTKREQFDKIKSEIASTVGQVSQEFDYHIMVAPLNSNGEAITSYPVILNNPSSVPSITTINQVNVESLRFFESVTGGSLELGFRRVRDLIKSNRENGIFRDESNLIVVMISNQDDDSASVDQNGNPLCSGNKCFNSQAFDREKRSLLQFSRKYSSLWSESGSPLNAQSFRFLTLVAHSNCNGFDRGSNYIKMSKDIYVEMGYTEQGNDTTPNSFDMCTGDYKSVFESVNSNIRQVLVGHSYDHWLISSAKESEIQPDDITVYKINGDQKIPIEQNNTNGFEYLGYQENINTRYLPSPGEPVTGLVIKLNGNARVSYPECVTAKTRTPTEYFGYIALNNAPDTSTIELKIRGKKYPESSENGWKYIGFLDTQNIKVPGPTNVATTPPINQSGYFLKLYGEAIFTNGENVEIDYKLAAPVD